MGVRLKRRGHTLILAPCQSMLWWKFHFNATPKHFVLTLEIHICWKFTISQPTLSSKPGPSLRHDAHRLDLSTNSRSLWTESNVKTRDVKNSLVHHAHLTINLHCAAHSENYANCVKCGTTNFAQRLVQISWHNNEFAQRLVQVVTVNGSKKTSVLLRQNCCWRFTSAASRRHIPRRFKIFCVTLCHLSTCPFDVTPRPLAFSDFRLDPHCSLVLNHTILLKFADAAATTLWLLQSFLTNMF